MSKLLLCSAAVLLLTNGAFAGEKKLMHCFAFTPIATATPAEWDAFFKATDELPKKIKGLRHVWYGKLAHPLKHNNAIREYGVCMEMDSAEVRENYGKDPAHEAWSKAYAKVHVDGTTTFDILGQ